MNEFRIDFCGVGVAKAGTSWIARCLGEHPAVCMARFKETNFFLRKHVSARLPGSRPKDASRYDEGLEWYRRMFQHHEPGQLRGEYSPAYFGDPESAGLLHDHNPQMKLLCSFRDPADAAYAGYHQVSLVRLVPETFEVFLDQHPEMLAYGRYHTNLQPFLERFPREHVHLMLYDDIRADPGAAYRGLCDFLGIDASFVPPSLTSRVNPRTVLRSRTLLRLRCALRAAVGSTAVTRKARRAIVRLGADRLVLKLLSLNERPGTVPPLAAETRRRLVDHFREETEALGDLLGRDLSHWNACP
jgi:hypothetical protein